MSMVKLCELTIPGRVISRIVWIYFPENFFTLMINPQSDLISRIDYFGSTWVMGSRPFWSNFFQSRPTALTPFQNAFINAKIELHNLTASTRKHRLVPTSFVMDRICTILTERSANFLISVFFLERKGRLLTITRQLLSTLMGRIMRCSPIFF